MFRVYKDQTGVSYSLLEATLSLEVQFAAVVRVLDCPDVVDDFSSESSDEVNDVLALYAAGEFRDL